MYNILALSVLENFGIIASSIVSVCTLLGTVYLFFKKIVVIEFKVNTLWDFMMRRAKSEAVNKGAGIMNSPLKLKPEAYQWFQGMAKDLKIFYASLPKPISDRDLFIQIENKFGDRMLKDICIPYGFDSGACNIMAMEVAKEPINENDGKAIVENNEQRMIRQGFIDRVKNAMGVSRPELIDRLSKLEDKVKGVSEAQTNTQIQSDKTDATANQNNKDQALTNQVQIRTSEKNAHDIKTLQQLEDIKTAVLSELVPTPVQELKPQDVVAVVPIPVAEAIKDLKQNTEHKNELSS